ncbi:unnamed protein product [Schistosoma margrebowiei]|uniref:Uncharacterized protein n=1 Tax=Schistosoma margrebowiei TaxID=48269 RepID=A0A183M497_9TREM|nr:unnamed protein product [Schistosoma margrebowiei]
MKTFTSEGNHGIQLTASTHFDDLDSAGDLVVLSHMHERTQLNSTSVAAASGSVGLNIHEGKSIIFKDDTANINPIALDRETLEDVDILTYLVSIIDDQGRTDADVKAKIEKAKTAFLYLKYI